MASSLLHVGYKSSFSIWHRKRYGREMLKFPLSNMYVGMFSDDCRHSSWKRQQPVLLRRLDNHPLLLHQNKSSARCPRSFEKRRICLQINVHSRVLERLQSAHLLFNTKGEKRSRKKCNSFVSKLPRSLAVVLFHSFLQSNESQFVSCFYCYCLYYWI